MEEPERYIEIPGFDQYLPPFKKGNTYNHDWATPWIKMARRPKNSQAWVKATAAQRGFLISLLWAYADSSLETDQNGYRCTKLLKLDIGYIKAITHLQQDRYVGSHLEYWRNAGFIAIAESVDGFSSALNRSDPSSLDHIGVEVRESVRVGRVGREAASEPDADRVGSEEEIDIPKRQDQEPNDEFDAEKFIEELNLADKVPPRRSRFAGFSE